MRAFHIDFQGARASGGQGGAAFCCVSSFACVAARAGPDTVAQFGRAGCFRGVCVCVCVCVLLFRVVVAAVVVGGRGGETFGCCGHSLLSARLFVAMPMTVARQSSSCKVAMDPL